MISTASKSNCGNPNRFTSRRKTIASTTVATLMISAR